MACLFAIAALLYPTPDLVCAAEAQRLGRLAITVFDVGYGDAILLDLPAGPRVLIDAGDAEHSEALLQALAQRNVRRLDALAITHPHFDHYGGATAILRKLPVRELWTNSRSAAEITPLAEQARRSGCRVRALARGDRITLDPAVEIRVLHPSPELHADPNDDSLVLLLRHGNVRLLLPGDIGVPIQSEIDTAVRGAPLDFIKLPHHGGPVLARWVSRQTWLALSVGPNPWGMPLPETLQLAPTHLARTDRDGDLLFISDGKRLQRLSPRDAKVQTPP